MPTDPFERNIAAFFEAWSARRSERPGLLAQACGPDVYYVDPVVQVHGIEGLAEHMHATWNLHRAAIAPTSGVDRHHEWARVSWNATDQVGRSLLHGTNLFEADGPALRIQQVVSFFASPPPLVHSFTTRSPGFSLG